MKLRGGHANESRTVYSTDAGDLRKKAKSPGADSGPAITGGVKVSLDTKGRRGKAVTLITGLAHDPGTIERIARELRSLCGAGGTVEGKSILVQGDHRDKIVARLQELGYKAKRAG